jgi:hypothetical protein
MLTPPDERFLRMRLQWNRSKTEVVIELEVGGPVHLSPISLMATFTISMVSSELVSQSQGAEEVLGCI